MNGDANIHEENEFKPVFCINVCVTINSVKADVDAKSDVTCKQGLKSDSSDYVLVLTEFFNTMVNERDT